MVGLVSGLADQLSASVPAPMCPAVVPLGLEAGEPGLDDYSENVGSTESNRVSCFDSGWDDCALCVHHASSISDGSYTVKPNDELPRTLRSEANPSNVKWSVDVDQVAGPPT